MNPDHFDHLGKRFGAWRLSRRRVVQGLGAAGMAGGALVLGRERAAADCPDITDCIGPRGPDQLHRPARFPIPGGPHGACWDWYRFACYPCASTYDALNAVCNQANPECGGRCTATYPF